MFSFRFTETLARWSARRPWLTLGGWVVVIVIGGYLATGIGDSLSTDGGATVELEADKAARLIEERMETDDAPAELVVVRSGTLTVDDPAFRTHVDAIATAARELRGSVSSVLTYHETGAEELVSASRRATIVAVQLTGDDTEASAAELHDAIAALPSDSFETYVTGMESIGVAFTETAEADLLRAEVFGLPVALVVLALVFGALAAAGIPIVIALLSILVSVGLTAVIGQQFTLSIFVVNVATMIGLAVGIDYSLFIIERFRDERRAGMDKVDAISRAGATATRTVLFSGITVIVALAGMLIIPDMIFRSISVGAILVVVVAVAASMTLLPAVLSLMGDKVNALRIPFVGRRTNDADKPGMWDRIARVVMAHPIISVAASVAVLLLAAAPYLGIQLGFAGVSTLPPNTDAYRGFVILDEEFTAGLIEPVNIVIDAADAGAPEIQEGVTNLRGAMAEDGAFGSSLVTISSDGTLVVVSAPMNGDPTGEASFDAVDRLRNDLIPAAFADTGADVFVGGETAGAQDYFALVRQYTPIIFAFVLGLSFIVLLVVFRSIVVPVKALLMNLLSVGAAYGLLVLVFQEGVGANLLGFQQVDRIEAWVPLFLFAVLFGLSMDYHVFLLSRIREHYDETHDNAESIVFGVRSTARIITGAALIMVAVFAGFAMGELVMFQQMGFGLAIAVLIDATIVRSILVPASMMLLGDANWYLPRWMSWLPDVNIEGAERASQPAMKGSTAAGG